MLEPEVVAILKLGTDGQTKAGNHIHFEVNLNELIWIENEIARLKKEFLNVQQNLKQTSEKM